MVDYPGNGNYQNPVRGFISVKPIPFYNSPRRGDTSAQMKACMNSVSSHKLALIAKPIGYRPYGAIGLRRSHLFYQYMAPNRASRSLF